MLQALVALLRRLFGGGAVRPQTSESERCAAIDHPDDLTPPAAQPLTADLTGDPIPEDLDHVDEDLSDVDVHDIADPLAGDDDAPEGD